ncbi:MAG: hypothetical protein NC293_03970 [Roseburia sp.]|nr:hypothetical protein [Roseburia sp.]
MRKKPFQAFISLLLCSLLLIDCVGVQDVEAAGIYAEPGESIQNWSYPVKCHTITKGNGNTMVIYSVLNAKKEQTLVLDLINSRGECTNYKKLSVPGETWGGTVYQAQDGCNYITTGNSGDIAFFVMKYSTEWDLLGTASITKDESYTDIAFDAGNSDMTLAGDYLIVHAARKRKDGHQSNFTSWIDTKTMKPVSIADAFPDTHVSHSFSQFVRYDGNRIIMIDQGDSYPRGISMISQLPDLDNKNTTESLLMKFWIAEGAYSDMRILNYTGTTVDGFELGRNHHLIVGKSIPHDRFTSSAEYEDYDVGINGSDNVYVILVDPNLGSSQLKWLTNNPSGETIGTVETVEMVKLDDDKFIILYGTNETRDTDDHTYDNYYTNYMLIDSNGNIEKSGRMEKKFYCTSEPSYDGGVLTWCHYMESELGNFMVLNRWNIETGDFSVQNIDLGIASKFGEISRLSTKRDYKQGESFELSLKIFSESFDSAPAVWKSSDNSVIQVVNEETMVSGSVGSSTEYKQKYKSVSTELLAKKQGTATISCEIGDKKWSGKLKVKGTAKEPGKVKKLSVKSKKNGRVIVSWKKVSDAEYYQLQYAARKNFKKKKTRRSIKKRKTTVYLGAKRKKKYYFRVRAYKWVGGKRIYGEWSKIVRKKCK